jgi:hypothetical protein
VLYGRDGLALDRAVELAVPVEYGFPERGVYVAGYADRLHLGLSHDFQHRTTGLWFYRFLACHTTAR